MTGRTKVALVLCVLAARSRSVADDGTARAIGSGARERVLAEHTYAHRAEQVETILGVRV